MNKFINSQCKPQPSTSYVINEGGAPSIQEGTSIPPAGNAGRLFLNTVNGILYRDNGNMWVPLQLGPKGDTGQQGPKGDAGPTTNVQPTINIYNCKCDSSNCNTNVDNNCSKSKFKTCFKPRENSKPKKSIDEKISYRLNNARVPSVLAGYILKCMRRFLAKEKPFDELERKVFKILSDKSTNEDLDCLQCILNNFNQLSRIESDKLFNENLLGNDPIEIEELRILLTEEANKRYSLYRGVVSNIECENTGVAGKPRPEEIIDTVPVIIPRIFSINGLRTSQHVPKLGYYDYTTEEFDYDCTNTAVCYPRMCLSENSCCNGDYFSVPILPILPVPGPEIKFCLAIPKTGVGETVILKGVNFVDANPKVKLHFNSPDGPVYKYIDATVCGDLITPVYETIDDVEHLIVDNRVNDILRFTIPEDLSFGLYKFSVVFNNTTGIGANQVETNPLYFQILPSSNSRFKVTLVKLECGDETDPEWLGSDEVMMSIFTVPFYSNNPGEPTSIFIEHDDVDTGNTFDHNEVIFDGSSIIGLSINIFGYEVDRVAEYWKYLGTNIVKEVISNLYGSQNLSRALIETASAIGLGYAIYYGISELASFLNSDDLIKDSIFLKEEDLSKLTITGYPKYGTKEYTFDGIKVKSQVISSPNDSSCIEKRDYWGEDSHYILYFKYERL